MRRLTLPPRLDRHRHTLAAILALLATICMVLSAYHFRPQALSLYHYRPTPGGPRDYYDPSAPWWAAAGALLLISALAVRRDPAPPRPAGRLAALRPRWARILTAPGALALLALAEANGDWIGVAALRGLSPHAQLALLVGGIAGVVLGLGGFGRAAGSPDPQPHQAEGASDTGFLAHSPDRRGARLRSGTWSSPVFEALALLALTLLALGLRLYRLEDAVRVLVDEVHFVLGVNYVRAYDDVPLLVPMPTAASFPFLFSYGVSEIGQLFGRNFLGLRAFSAVLGALTVPAVYLLGRALFDRLTAWIAALVLLSFPPHLHYSRLALNNIADPLFGTLALGFMARALRTHRRSDWALAGSLLGLTQVFYEGGRLLYPALAVAWLMGGAIVWRPRPAWRGVLIALLAFGAVALPVYATLEALDFPLTDRMEKAGYGEQYWSANREPDTLATRVRHFRHGLLHYINAPENTVFHYYLYYGGAHPLIQEPLVPLFLLGMGITLARPRRVTLLLPAWILATAAGSALLVESAVSARFVVAFPAIALLIACGLRQTAALIVPRRAERLASLAVLSLAVGIAAGQAQYYFGPHLTRFEREVREYPEADAEDAILRAVDFPPGTEVHLIGSRLLPQRDAQHFADYLADGLVITVLPPEALTLELLGSLPRHVDHAFFVAPGQTLVLATLAGAFGPRPLGRTPIAEVRVDRAMLLFYLPADRRAAPPVPAVG